MQSDKPSNLSELTGEIKGWQDAIAFVERDLAAKDAELAELREWRWEQIQVSGYRALELNDAIMDFDATKYWGQRHADAMLDIVQRAKAAERERDSLREELVQAKCLLIRAADDLAALKAGKDGQ